MKEETHKRLLFILRIIMAVIIGLALILIIYSYIGRAFQDYGSKWTNTLYDTAYQLYKGDISIKQIPSYSLLGFPIKYYFLTPILITLLLSVILMPCLKVKVRFAIICSAIVLVIFEIVSGCVAYDYYLNYRNNICDVKNQFEPSWYHDDNVVYIDLSDIEGYY